MAAKTRMVICDPSYMKLAKTKVIGKVVRYTNTHETPIPELLNEDGISIDTGQIIITQKLEVRKNDINATMVSWRQLVTSVDKYWEGGGRLVGQGLHHTSLHTHMPHTGSRDTSVSFLFAILFLHVRDVSRVCVPFPFFCWVRMCSFHGCRASL